MIMIKTAFVAVLAASVVSSIVAVVPPTAASAEERDASSDIELLRADIRTKKMQLIAERMQFTGKEADIFWPLYRKYEVELAAINDKKAAVMQDYVNSYESLGDAGAKDLARRVFEVDQMTLDLRKNADAIKGAIQERYLAIRMTEAPAEALKHFAPLRRSRAGRSILQVMGRGILGLAWWQQARVAEKARLAGLALRLQWQAPSGTP